MQTESQPLAPTRIRQKPTSSSRHTRWNQEEDSLLIKLVDGSEHINWNEVAQSFPGKTVQQVSERWGKVVNPKLIKGSWTRQEDETIIDFVKNYGVKNWTKLSTYLPGRIGKQCRERWRNHLDPDVNRDPWTQEEDQILLELHELYGNQWVKISSLIPGRSDNSIKNRWNSTLKKNPPAEVGVRCTPVVQKTRFKVETPPSVEAVEQPYPHFVDVPQPVDIEGQWTPRLNGFEVPSMNMKSPAFQSPSKSPLFFPPWTPECLKTPKGLFSPIITRSPSLGAANRMTLISAFEELEKEK